MMKLTKPVTSDSITDVAAQVAPPWSMSVEYTFMEYGEEVTRMFNFTAKNEQQYEQFNRAFLSATL